VPNIKSAIKRVKVAERRRKRNRSVRSSVRTYVRTAERSIVTARGDAAATSAEAVARALKELDSAASKGVIHKNNAARRKSRLMKKFNQANAAS
jgi:small subunit ribosomal protein S20